MADRRLLDAVALVAGVDRVLVMDEKLRGESRSTFAVAAGGDEFVVKLVQGSIDNCPRASCSARCFPASLPRSSCSATRAIWPSRRGPHG